MKTSLFLGLGLGIAAALLSACIPSVNPFYTNKDVRFEDRLLGVWRGTNSSEGPQTWTFEKSGENAYALTIVEKENKAGKFSAHLFQLDNQFYMDLTAVECNFATNQADLVGLSVFPGHLLVRVPQLEPELKLAFFDFDWLQKYLKANPKALASHVEGDRILLTAQTRDLQRFVLKHADELFQKPDQLVRVSAQAKQ